MAMGAMASALRLAQASSSKCGWVPGAPTLTSNCGTGSPRDRQSPPWPTTLRLTGKFNRYTQQRQPIKPNETIRKA